MAGVRCTASTAVPAITPARRTANFIGRLFRLRLRSFALFEQGQSLLAVSIFRIEAKRRAQFSFGASIIPAALPRLPQHAMNLRLIRIGSLEPLQTCDAFLVFARLHK